MVLISGPCTSQPSLYDQLWMTDVMAKSSLNYLIGLTSSLLCRSGVGISGSKQTLFYAEVTDDMKVGPGGGLAQEGELIEVVELPLAQGRILMMDESKTKPVGLMFALMWFFDK